MTDQTQLMQHALRFALENPYSDFYRRKYGTNYARFFGEPIEDIPFLTRPEIEAVPMLERSFVPSNLIRFIRSTSGSTGRSVIGFPMLEEGLFQEHLRAIGYEPQAGQSSRYFEPYFSEMKISSVLLFSAGAFVHEVRLREMEGRQLISGEFSEPNLTARLAADAKVEAMIGNPSGLLDFAPHLVAEGGASAMRLIISVGERPTSLQLSRLGELFPNAKVALQYGLTESQGYVGYTCPQRLSVDPKALHLASSTFCMELIDPDTLQSLPLVPGTEGELVVTSHEPQGFPLIRYRTGDMVRMRHEHCGCEGEPPLFECMGRIALDRMRIPRGVLTIAAIDEGLAAAGVRAEEFTAAWDAAATPPGLTITLYMKEGETPAPDVVASQIRIAPDITYRVISEAGLAAPLRITVSEPSSWIGWKKKKRLS